MSEKTEVAKEFAKIAMEGLLVAVSLLALNGAAVYMIHTWLGFALAISVVLGSTAVLLFVLMSMALIFSYNLAKHRVQRRKSNLQ